MFGFRPRQTVQKKFSPPAEFEYNLQLALRLMACESRGDFPCIIEAAGDTITLRINGIENLGGLAKRYSEEVYRYYFSHPTYNGGSLRLTFREPDCYIFGCNREGMQYDLDTHAPNAVISAWTESAGKKTISLRFAPFSGADEVSRWDAFENFCNIWLK